MPKLLRISSFPFLYGTRNAFGSVELINPNLFVIRSVHPDDDYVIESNGNWYTKGILNIFYKYPSNLRMDYQYLLDILLEEERIMKENMMKKLLIFSEVYNSPVGLPELFDVVRGFGVELIKKKLRNI